MTPSRTLAARLEEAARGYDIHQHLGTALTSEEAAETAALLREAAQALASSDQGTGWQPIATAPKDGTGILAVQGSNMRVCSWTQCGWTFYQSKLGAPFVIMIAPTHWQPLPPPPREVP